MPYSLTPAQAGSVLLCAILLAPAIALAAPPVVQIPTDESFQTGPGAGYESGLTGLFTGLERRQLLLGNMGGLRSALSSVGISFALQETSEVLGNVTGGTKTGAAYDGLTTAILQLDTQRAFGWYGGTFNVSALQSHGRNLSADNLSTIQTASGIEADRATRLWELWYQQKFLDEDRLDIKIGQQSLDQEFMVTANGLYFVNTMFGWPTVPSYDMPGGGPAYPLSALGVRARYRPTDSITMLAGLFNGSPTVRDYGDPQMQNASGTSFPVHGGALLIAELQYAYPSLGTMLYAGESEPLGRVYKIGFWYDTERFADQRYDNTGLSLADPNSNGTPLTHHGDYAIYAVADQIVWQQADEADRTVSVFARVMGTPRSDRNLITFSANAGLTFHEPFLHRDDDTFGIGLGYAKVSNRAAALDRDTNQFNATGFPIRGSETFVELTYQYSVAPWLQLQPDFQYVFHPGGGLADPDTGKRIHNEAVFGLRTNIVF
jgi:porin